MIHDLTLETERLILRRPAAPDKDAIVAFYMSERSQYTGGHLPKFSAWKMAAMMYGQWEINGFGLWAVTMKGDDSILGLVGPFYPDGWPETEFGWLMLEGSEGKGIAYEAAQAALRDARERLGWTDIVHYINPANERSVALAERLGAVYDPEAPQPFPDRPALVYRQPKPEGQA